MALLDRVFITSTAEELSVGANIDDPERHRTPKIGVLVDFFAILICETHFKTELRRNHTLR